MRGSTGAPWLSTTGPADLVGTRYFEVMSTGTTLCLCNRMPGTLLLVLHSELYGIVSQRLAQLICAVTNHHMGTIRLQR